MKYSGKVLIDEQSSPGMRTTRNPKAVANVNQPQGPRTGVAARAGKRADFKAAKAEREPLAEMITGAFAARDPKDHVNAKLEPIRSNSKESYRTKAK